jgi:hypothetical protein
MEIDLWARSCTCTPLIRSTGYSRYYVTLRHLEYCETGVITVSDAYLDTKYSRFGRFLYH